MKKSIFVLSVIILLVSCIKKVPPDVPVLSVTPTNNLVISPTLPIIFTVEGHAAEELKKFSITTSPHFFSMDTNFMEFVHTYKHKIKVSIPETLPALGEDSIVTATLTLSDSYANTKKIIKIKVQNGYLNLLSTRDSLFFKKNFAMFYSVVDTKALTFWQLNEYEMDFVLLYDKDFNFTIASPDAPYIIPTLEKLGYSYTIESKKHTKLTSISTTMESITPKFMHHLKIKNSYINDNMKNGVGKNNLKERQIIIFETKGGIKGALNIIDIDTSAKKIVFEMKYQKK